VDAALNDKPRPNISAWLVERRLKCPTPQIKTHATAMLRAPHSLDGALGSP
jgi:hypothetical protein